MVGLPSGTVTFLFSDLELSTRLWEKHHEAMVQARDRFFEIVDGAVVAAGGAVFSHTGDGVAAAFVSASDALRAAIEAQRALGVEPWGETGALRARMGLHTGEGVLVGEDQYDSHPLNRCARLMGVGHGGQVLVSGATAALVIDALVDGVALEDLGEHRLRDLAHPMRVYQVRAPGLHAAFGRLSTLDALPGNLPAQATSFVGRVDDVAAVAAALEQSRLVTLTGVGGVGKTRLAVQTAAEVLPEFPDGAWLCELAAAGDPDAMIQVVAAALRVQAVPGVALEDRIAEVLAQGQLLVVLDNCEHLLDPACQLAERLLGSCAQLRFLATSREPLGISGEQVIRVRSLPVYDTRSALEAGDLSDAVRLFVERARHVEHGFEVNDANVRTVDEICRRLDGIPLAIELAAARVVAMSPVEILALLDERFRLLTGGRRTAVERHQTLRAAVDWSYSLLDPIEQLVFARLAVFPGTFDATGARAVAVGDGVEAWDVLDALAGLVNKSMLNTVAGPAGTTRYQLLETMRQYGRERLDGLGDADRCRRAHAAHYEAFMVDYTRAFTADTDLPVAFDALLVEFDNLRVAVSWALDSDVVGDVDIALRIAGAGAGLSPVARRAAGLTSQADRLLERAESSRPELRGGVLAGLAADAMLLRGDPVTAGHLARRALDDGPIFPAALAMAYVVLAASVARDGDVAGQIALLVEGQQAVATRFGDTAHSRAFFETWIAVAYRRLGDEHAAADHAAEAARLAREAEFPFRQLQTLIVQAELLRPEQPETADEVLNEALALPDISTASFLKGQAVLCRARVRVALGDADGATELLALLPRYWNQEIIPSAVAEWTRSLAALLADLDQSTPAAVFIGAAQSEPRSHFPPVFGPYSRTELHDTARRVHTTLGDDTYAHETARGAHMTDDELMRFLRATIDQLSMPPRD